MKTKIAVVYHYFPHYREPIMRELVGSDRYSFAFYGSHAVHEGIKVFTGDAQIPVHPLRFKMLGRIWMLRGYWEPLIDPRISGLVVHGHPYMPAAWMIILVTKVLRKKLIFWTHGWLRPESHLKRFVKNIFYSNADAVMTYGERAITVAQSDGYTQRNIFPIGNSLDWPRAQLALRKIREDPLKHTFKSLFGSPDRPLIICSARLTAACRFDLLIEAARICAASEFPLNVLLIGDGPERSTLEQMAAECSVDVHFYGACYDEEVIAAATYEAELTVSPGKVGLTAIQSLTYGTPVITHGDFNAQMPEVEAIQAGRTGEFFARDSAQDLARVVRHWLSTRLDRDAVRIDCMNAVASRWNPMSQREAIEAVLDQVFS